MVRPFLSVVAGGMLLAGAPAPAAFGQSTSPNSYSGCSGPSSPGGTTGPSSSGYGGAAYPSSPASSATRSLASTSPATGSLATVALARANLSRASAMVTLVSGPGPGSALQSAASASYGYLRDTNCSPSRYSLCASAQRAQLTSAIAGRQLAARQYTAALQSGLYGGYYEDPYTGYLRGTADCINSDGRSLNETQQARLLQTQADAATLDLRHRIAEEVAAERKNWLNPEAERVKAMQAAYERATREAPVTEVLSGQALNDLYNHVYPLQAKGAKGPAVQLDEDLLKQINFSGAGAGGSVALLKDRGRFYWPLALQSPEFDGPRKELTVLAADAVNQTRLNKPVGAATLRDMKADVRRMSETLLKNVGEVPPSQYVEAKRYLNGLEAAVKALQDPNAANQLSQVWSPPTRTVAELVEFMGHKGLKFAPATAGDEPAYRHLYERLVAFANGVTAQTSTAAGNP